MIDESSLDMLIFTAINYNITNTRTKISKTHGDTKTTQTMNNTNTNLNHKPNNDNYSPEDIYFMEYVLKLAQNAYDNGEVPIGAIVVAEGEIVGVGQNRKETRQDTVAHAEILAIQDASKKLGSWRLNNSTLYTNIEPCIMCCGAIIHARINRVVFCTNEPKFGGIISQTNLFDIPTLNHKVNYQYGLMQNESQTLIRRFFREIRTKLNS